MSNRIPRRRFAERDRIITRVRQDQAFESYAYNIELANRRAKALDAGLASPKFLTTPLVARKMAATIACHAHNVTKGVIAEIEQEMALMELQLALALKH